MTSKYVNERNLQTAMTEYNKDLKAGRVVEDQYDNKIGYATQVYDNTSGDGEQVYAVIDNPNQDPDKVWTVTVLFRGSSSPDQLFSQPGDVWNDWIENDALLAMRVNSQGHPNLPEGTHDRVTGQPKTAAKALNQIMETYPRAQVKIYGHSLGSMNAQYAMATLSETNVKRVRSAHIYNGPNIYSLLSNKQKERVDSIKGRINNYADPKDFISMVGRKVEEESVGSVGMVHYVDSHKVGMVNQHMTHGYQLDKDGYIKTVTTPQAKTLYQVTSSMQHYYSVKDKLSATGGGLNHHETFFLDSEQATILGEGLSKVSATGYDQMTAIRNEAMEEADALYSSLSIVPEGFILSPDEVMEAYAEAGVDYHSMVVHVIDELDSQVDKGEALAADFADLKSSIQSGVDEAVAKDSELAAKINEWK